MGRNTKEVITVEPRRAKWVGRYYSVDGTQRIGTVQDTPEEAKLDAQARREWEYERQHLLASAFPPAVFDQRRATRHPN